MSTDPNKLHANEGIKTRSNYLRGTLAESIQNPLTGGIPEEDAQLTKFHGFYIQDDRDVRAERRKKKLEKAHSFMIRLRIPGGVITPEQWIAIDRIADTWANGQLRLTTRQTFQYHGVIKGNLKRTIQDINKACIDTIAACGDVNRNVMCNPNPYQSHLHAEVHKLAEAISSHLLPRTRAYHELWLDEEKVSGGAEPEEPLYGATYLPRKFKVVIAVPPSNDVDIYAHDLGFIAIADDQGQLVGYNVTVGGGMGMTHGREDTFPRLADLLGFCTPEQAVDVAEKVMTTQRDFGNRSDRAQARLKYTIERMGLEAFRAEVEQRLGYPLQTAREFSFESNGDRYGWTQGADGKQHLTLFIQNGRIKDSADYPLKTGLLEIAKIHKGDFRMTANQNVIIGCVAPEDKPAIEQLINQYKLYKGLHQTGMRLSSMACVALPTCGLALAESERYLPDVVTQLEEIMKEHGLRDDSIVIRMTGCPNGCARPYLGEIAFVGKAPGVYNVYLGAAFNGNRLNKLYRDAVPQDNLVPLLRPILIDYATHRKKGEHFGDFVIRAGYVAPTRKGSEFHNDVKYKEYMI
ncbi:MAG: assimilatory sulfite reductase (NADPH) hemoprotein subunit [Puniceicoccaceae bacterium]